MAKYADWSDFERNAPIIYKERATGDAYRRGMNKIAPPGMKVKEGRVTHYAAGVADKGDDLVAGYKRAMFE